MSFTLSLTRLALRNARNYATHITTGPRGGPAVLHLKTGQSFAGRSFGAPKSVFGETVFSTSITSCKRLFFRCVIGASETQGGDRLSEGPTDIPTSERFVGSPQ